MKQVHLCLTVRVVLFYREFFSDSLEFWLYVELPREKLKDLLRYNVRSCNLPLMAELALFRQGEFVANDKLYTDICGLVSLYPPDQQVSCHCRGDDVAHQCVCVLCCLV